jgi:hypothetical protein
MHIGELYDLYFSPSINRVGKIKDDEMEGVYREEDKCILGSGEKTCKDRDHLEDLRVDGKISLKSVLKKQDGRVWTRFI